jgi:hypothetical protein
MKKLFIGLLSMCSLSAFAQSEYLPGKIVDKRSGDEIRVKCVSGALNDCQAIQYELHRYSMPYGTPISRPFETKNLKEQLQSKALATSKAWGHLSIIRTNETENSDADVDLNLEESFIQSKTVDLVYIMLSEGKYDGDKFGNIGKDETIVESIAKDTGRASLAILALPVGLAVDAVGTAIAIVVSPFTLSADGIKQVAVKRKVRKLTSIIDTGEDIEVGLADFRRIVKYLKKI